MPTIAQGHAMTKLIINGCFLCLLAAGCHDGVLADRRAAPTPRRFFAADSFWNTPLPHQVDIDPRSSHWITLLKTDPSQQNFVINVNQWTIPVYEATVKTATYPIQPYYLSETEKKEWATTRSQFGHGVDFAEVPIPAHASPDPEEDAHFAVIDWNRMLAWDMWGLRRLPGGGWSSKTGMKYRLDGDGLFHIQDFPVRDGESLHFHGPSRAAGVPAIAGLIMHHEVLAGEIRHKLAGATRFNARQEFVFPAIWTDGATPGGIPEGAVLQLDPALDLNQFALLPGERVVARALQRYGLVLVDNAGDSTLYAEGRWSHPGHDWKGILRSHEGGISAIPLEHYRVLRLGKIVHGGDTSVGQSR
jgi:hypothetical protein